MNITLKNGTTFTGSFSYNLNQITTDCVTDDAACLLCAAVTDDSVSEITLTSDDGSTATLTDRSLIEPAMRQDIDGKVRVKVRLKQLTQTEINLRNLTESQDSMNEVLEQLVTEVIPSIVEEKEDEEEDSEVIDLGMESMPMATS